MIQIKSRVIDAIYRHALASYPSECCGIVIGKKNAGAEEPSPHSSGEATSPLQLDTVFPCRNIYDDMRAKDPEKFPRSSKTAYFLDPKDLFNIQKMARAANSEMKMIYHSHVDVGAYFSDEDKKQAAYDGNPLYPGVMYLVVDVTKDKVRGAKLFGWNSENRDFTELNWQIA